MSRARELLARTRALKQSLKPAVALARPRAQALLDKLAASFAEEAGPKLKGLTILSNGLGRDSATLVALLVEGNLVVDGRKIAPRGVDAVIFSDVGYEWSFTYSVIPVMTKMLEAVGVPFYVIRKPPREAWEGHLRKKEAAFAQAWAASGGRVKSRKFLDIMARNKQPPPWLEEEWSSIAAKAQGGGYHRAAPLMQEMMAYRRMNMRSSPECTDRHKIQPINALIGDMVQAKYGLSLRQWGNRVLKGTATQHKVLIGFAADEQERIERGGKAILTKLIINPADEEMGERLYALDFEWLDGEDKEGYPYIDAMEGRLTVPALKAFMRVLEASGSRKVAWSPAGEKPKTAYLAPGEYRMQLGKVWKKELYPLSDMGITKAGEAVVLKRNKLNWIRKSGCIFCHFQPIEWFWALKQLNPKMYARVQAYERNALRRNPKWFLRGSSPLDDQVREWRRKNPRAGIEEVLDKSYDRCGAFNICPNCGRPQ
jgi:hypothetical protein